MSGRVSVNGGVRLAAMAMSLAALFMVSACATAPKDPEARAQFEKENDPIEPLNRAIFSFNLTIDKMLLRPAAVAYSEVLPQPVQDGVNNFLTNLRSPVVLANDVLQGEFSRAGDTVGRFVINSTIGVLGVWDPASRLGLQPHSEDFGQTFAVWGVGEGFYLVLPILGPSNPRDAAGLVVEWLTDPFNIWLREENLDGWIWARSLVTGIDFRARNLQTLDELERTSLDYYVAIRSLYRQRREDAINNGESLPDQPAPGISQGPGEKPESEPNSAQAQ